MYVYTHTLMYSCPKRYRNVAVVLKLVLQCFVNVRAPLLSHAKRDGRYSCIFQWLKITSISFSRFCGQEFGQDLAKQFFFVTWFTEVAWGHLVVHVAFWRVQVQLCSLSEVRAGELEDWAQLDY